MSTSIIKISLTLFSILLYSLIAPTATHARSVTYIGNYEVTTEDNGLKKEVVRVAGSMGKVVKSRNILGNNTPSKWDYAYYTTDAQGSTRQEISENQLANPSTGGQIPKPNTYYAYGTPVILSGSEGSRLLNAQTQKVEDTYTGQKKDEETGLMYYNARYYNPATGLFLQADSVDDGQNKYQYVAGNPVNSTDPTGNECTQNDPNNPDCHPKNPGVRDDSDLFSNLEKSTTELSKPFVQTEEEIRVREINNQLRKFSTLYSSNTFRIVAEILPYNAEEIIIRVSNMTLTEAQIEEGKARIEAYYKKQMAIEDMVVGDITFDTSMSSPDEKIAESRRQEKHTSSVTRGAQMEAYERYTNALFIADDMNVYRQRILQIIIRENKLTSPSLNQSPQKVFERQTAFLDLLEWASPSKSQTTESP